MGDGVDTSAATGPWCRREKEIMSRGEARFGDALTRPLPLQDPTIIDAPAPRPDQLPMGASRNTWPNIVNNKVPPRPTLSLGLPAPPSVTVVRAAVWRIRGFCFWL